MEVLFSCFVRLVDFNTRKGSRTSDGSGLRPLRDRLELYSEGVKAISRWLSAATPPVNAQRNVDPEGITETLHQILRIILHPGAIQHFN
jgi:hypothetical protein